MEDWISRQEAMDAFDAKCYPIRCDGAGEERGMNIAGIRQVLADLAARNSWISVDKIMPEEHDAKMLRRLGIKKQSKKVAIIIECLDGERIVDTNACTKDGVWDSPYLRGLGHVRRACKVVAWQPWPQVYK